MVGLIRLLIVVRIALVLAFIKGESRRRKEKERRMNGWKKKESNMSMSISAGQIDGFGFYLVNFNVITYDSYLGKNG